MMLLLRLLSLLPFTTQLMIGRKLGHLGLRLLKRRKNIAQINLKLAFPNLSSNKLDQLLTQHFESLGMAIFESSFAWWGSSNQLKSRMKITGLEYIDRALQDGKGILLFGAHFTTLDLSGSMLATQKQVHAVYRPNENPVFDWFITKGRKHMLSSIIPRDNMRQIINKLKNNEIVWSAMDQNYGHKGSVFSDFFSVPAATNTATSRLVRITGASVIPFFAKRNGNIYELTLMPPVKMDGSDIQAESDHLNHLVEKMVLQAPEQYLWIHRRFKDRPNDEQGFY